jgi:hypothetical protein
VICDELYLVESKKAVSCLDSSGQWALFRHKHNERGDTSSKVRRQQSVEEIGILQDIREPPWVMAASDGHAEHWDLIHWATLLADGARAAWEADVQKKLRTVQLAVNTKIENCKVFNKRMPKAVVLFYVDYANMLNNESTATTFLQVWRSTKEVKLGFKVKKQQMGWSMENMTSTKLNDKE